MWCSGRVSQTGGMCLSAKRNFHLTVFGEEVRCSTSASVLWECQWNICSFLILSQSWMLGFHAGSLCPV